MTDRYNDIINLPHHVSSTRAPMSMQDRAAQFSPFAALVGYDDAIRETGRLTEQKIELGEEQLSVLNRKYQILTQHLADHPEVTIVYFEPDKFKSGGAYLSVTGVVKKIREYEAEIILEDGTVISIESILDISGPLFVDLESTFE